MNVENIKELSAIMGRVGFENLTRCLILRICFQPDQFTVCRILSKGRDSVAFHFHFHRQTGTEIYVLDYYDAVLQKEPVLQEVLNGIDVSSLQMRMADIDWPEVFRSTDAVAGAWDEKKTWAEAEAIASIISDLALLEAEGGREVAAGLKQKYWEGTAYQEFTGRTLSGRAKAEISQRFFLYGESIISADEAYRFLQNRWLEKELGDKKRLTAKGHADNRKNGSEEGTGFRSRRRKKSNKGAH